MMETYLEQVFSLLAIQQALNARVEIEGRTIASLLALAA